MKMRARRHLALNRNVGLWVFAVACGSSWAQQAGEALLQHVPIEEHSYVQERLAAHTSVTDVPQAVATWQFIRRYGEGIEGLSVNDGHLLAELVDMDRIQLGKDASWRIVGKLCREYGASQLDVVGAARMFDMARDVQNDAFERGVRAALDRLSPAGKEVLAKSQANVNVVAQRRQTQDWEGMARDAPHFTRRIMSQVCQRHSGLATGAGDGTPARVIREVVRVSGQDATKATRTGMDVSLGNASAGSASSVPSGRIDIGIGRRDASASVSLHDKSKE